MIIINKVTAPENIPDGYIFGDLVKGQCFNIATNSTLYMKVNNNNQRNAIRLETGDLVQVGSYYKVIPQNKVVIKKGSL